MSLIILKLKRGLSLMAWDSRHGAWIDLCFFLTMWEVGKMMWYKLTLILLV